MLDNLHNCSQVNEDPFQTSASLTRRESHQNPTRWEIYSAVCLDVTLSYFKAWMSTAYYCTKYISHEQNLNFKQLIYSTEQSMVLGI